MRLKKKLTTTGVAALVGLAGTAVGAAVLPAAPASAQVLINYPGTTVKVGHSFTVGDWFQQWSGGSRWFTTAVYGPTGTRVFHITGYAPSTHWDMWSVKATRSGTYKVLYETRRGNGHDLSTWYTVKAYR
ncbi:MAG: hypothetical protein JO016_20310 [Actinobacteria bacterium]|nr:hypothetical protein [Actinomycetota bacterium]